MPGNHNANVADLIPSKTNRNCLRGITMSANFTVLSHSKLCTICKITNLGYYAIDLWSNWGNAWFNSRGIWVWK